MTATAGRWPPTFLAQPLRPADLKRFKPGTRLKIEGELVQYLDLDEQGIPDEVYIDRARFTEINDVDGTLTTSR